MRLALREPQTGAGARNSPGSLQGHSRSVGFGRRATVEIAANSEISAISIFNDAPLASDFTPN